MVIIDAHNSKSWKIQTTMYANISNTKRYIKYELSYELCMLFILVHSRLIIYELLKAPLEAIDK